MANLHVIEKLIIDFDFDKEQVYHNFANYLTQHLLQSLSQKIEQLLNKVVINPSENIIINKIEVDLEQLSLADIQSNKLISKIIDAIKIEIEELAPIIHRTKSQNDFKENAFGSFDEKNPTPPSIYSFTSPDNTQSLANQIIPNARFYSLQHYFLTGQFVSGNQWKKKDINNFFRKETNLNQIVSWVETLPAPQQKINVLARVLLQLTPNQKKWITSQSVMNGFLANLAKLQILLDDKRLSEQEVIVYLQANPSLLKSLFPKTKQVAVAFQQLQDLLKEIPKIKHLLKRNSLTKKQILKQKEPTPKRKHVYGKVASQLKANEGLYIENAGMILVGPYLIPLFARCGLLNFIQKSFKNEASAAYGVHLLDYLANKRTLETEHNTFLYKVLCGLPLDATVLTKIKVSEEDKQTVDRLLLQIVNQWDIKMGGQIDLLRGSFFVREGKLMEASKNWSLFVQARSYDKYLFKSLPWSFKMIKYPWMPKFLQVDWY